MIVFIYLDAGIVEVDAVRVELAVRLSFLIAEIVVGPNDDIVAVDKVGSEIVGCKMIIVWPWLVYLEHCPLY